MALTDTLRRLGVKSPQADTAFDCALLDPPAVSRAERFRMDHPTRQPLVSCLMVTRGNLDILCFAVDCYRQQTWAQRELVIVTGRDQAPDVAAYLHSAGVENASVTGVDPGMSLGDLRNMSVARAKGDIVIQWDDDDLYDPERITLAVSVLLKAGVAAAFLARWVIWWPAREIAAISCRRVCEGTVAMWRGCAPNYPAVARSEDTAAISYLNEKVALIDAPLHYIYAITGQNTWDDEHFRVHLAGADYIFEGAQYREFFEVLARRVPIAAYAERLRQA